jgi:hypothetical protein
MLDAMLICAFDCLAAGMQGYNGSQLWDTSFAVQAISCLC